MKTLNELFQNRKFTIFKQHAKWYLVCSIFCYFFALWFSYLVEAYVSFKTFNFFDGFTTYIAHRLGDFTIATVFILTLIVFLLSNNMITAISVISVLGIILSIASEIKYSIRMELFNYKDLLLTEVGGLAIKMIKIDINIKLIQMLLGAVIFIVLAVILQSFRKKELACLKSKAEMVIRFVCAFLMCFALYRCVDDTMRKNNDINYISRQQLQNNKFVIYHFLENKKTYVNEGTISEAYKVLLEKADESGIAVRYTKDRPNVIVIMNESWWNLGNASFSSVQMDNDPNALFETLKQKCAYGSVSPNVYGGGTIGSEYEFYSGLNTKYDIVPTAVFNNLLDCGKAVSMIDYFKNLGYYTIGMHSCVPTYYNRKKAYATLGFDKIVFDEDMLYKEPYIKFISDDSLVKQIIYEYENNKNGEKQPMFLFSVSVGNHLSLLSYSNPENMNYDYPIKISIPESKLNKTAKKQFIDYINGIYLATKAYQTLIEYFEKVDEPTVIMMYGDHAPYFSDDMLELMGLNIQSTDINELRKIYETPVLLWKNFGDVKENTCVVDGNGIGYLSNVLFEYANLPTCPMTRIQAYESLFIKANTYFYAMGPDNKPLGELSGEILDALIKFRQIQTDLINYSEKSICQDIWTPDQ